MPSIKETHPGNLAWNFDAVVGLLDKMDIGFSLETFDGNQIKYLANRVRNVSPDNLPNALGKVGRERLVKFTSRSNINIMTIRDAFPDDNEVEEAMDHLVIHGLATIPRNRFWAAYALVTIVIGAPYHTPENKTKLLATAFVTDNQFQESQNRSELAVAFWLLDQRGIHVE